MPTKKETALRAKLAAIKAKKHVLARKMRRNGRTFEEIGAAYGVTHVTAMRWCTGPLRPRARAKSPQTKARERRLAALKKLLVAKKAGAFSTRDAQVVLGQKTRIFASRRTLNRDMRALDYLPRVRPKTTVFAADVQRRLAFCRANRNEEGADNNIFSDETLRTTNDGTDRVEWTHKSERPSARMNARYPAARVHIWGAIGINFRHLVIFPNSAKNDDNENCTFRLNHESYKRLCLQGTLMNHLTANPNLVFQQDGASCHRAKGVLQYLANKKVKLMNNWPAHSPDLSPIETVWAYLRPRISKHCPKTRDQLTRAIQTEWDAMPVDYVNKLVRSFPKRCESVIQKGGKQ